jgi:uncharacterized caspase-like protein
VGKRFASEKGRRFKNTHIKILSDLTANKPLRANVISALDFVKASKAEDTVVIFLASHGMSDAAGNYYFVPRDAQPDDAKNLDKLKPDEVKSMIGWSVFFDALRSSAGRRVLIVDTCHSGDIAGTVDLHSLSKRSAASLFSLVSASKGSEYSQEHDVGQHGLFTYSMLEAMNSTATDMNRDGVISISEMFAGIAPLVEKLRDPSVPQTPQKMVPDPLGEVMIVSLPDDKRPPNAEPPIENLGCGIRSLDTGRRESGCVADSRKFK